MGKCNCGKKPCCCERNREKKNLQCDCDMIHQELVEKAKQKVLEDDLLISIADFYKAMSDSTRVKILNLLEAEELCVCDIAYVLNMTKSAVSHQLKNLKQLNLVKSKKVGKEVWYSLSDRHVKEVFEVTIEHVLEENDEEDC